MPIRILDSPEPLTEASYGTDPVLIGSDVLMVLQQEMIRYCEQRVAGRSFLIAGHRGAGKTTLVQGAFQQVRAARNQAAERFALSGREELVANRLRPLLVLLQGPNLLPAATTRPKKDGGSKESGQDSATDSKKNGGADAGNAEEDEAQTGWQEGLRSALPKLSDEELRRRVEESLEHEPQDLEQMKSLWVEIQERAGQMGPAEKLNLLLESARPYCTEKEFLQVGRKHLQP